MFLPGKVLILDDKQNEIKTLVAYLSKMNIPSVYFDGNLDSLPESPFNDVSCIFLDINLTDGSQSDKEIESMLRARLGKLIAADNIPFVLFVWSKFQDKYKEIIHQIFYGEKRITVLPIELHQLSKIDFFPAGEAQIDDGERLKILDEKLSAFLSKESFKFFSMWGKVQQSAFLKIYKDLFSTSEKKDWHAMVNNIIMELSDAYFGEEGEAVSDVQKIGYAKMLLGEVLADNIISFSSNYPVADLPKFRPSINTGQEKAHRSLINQSLLLGGPVEIKNFPGNCFIMPEYDTAYELLNSLIDESWFTKSKFEFENQEEFTKIKGKIKGRQTISEEEQVFWEKALIEQRKHRKDLIDTLNKKSKVGEFVVSPVCDFAQGKSLRVRVLPFVMAKITDLKNKKQFGKTESCYISPTFFFEKDEYCFITSFLLLHSRPLAYFDTHTPFARLKSQILCDIQYKMSANVGRPGIVFLES